MTSGVAIDVAAIVGGALLAFLSVRSVVRDLKSGKVAGRVNSLRRDAAPATFWFAIGAALFAGAIGFAFVAFGLARIAAH